MCGECDRNFPIKQDVPHFVRNQPYWGEVTEPIMRQILEAAPRVGWEAALADALPDGRGETFDYLTNPARAQWAHFLPIPEGGLVLDVGSGLGAIAVGLANHGYNVVAAEPVDLRARFLRIRANQQEIRNLYPICASVFELPYADLTFDGIIMNNVLEWVPYSRLEMSPGVAQAASLAYLYRKLKPGGHLHLVIENRWGPVLFTGLKDPHAGLRFTTILPRFAADLYSRVRRSEPYRTYLYSRSGYKRLLTRAGFSNIEFHGMLPSSRNYFYYFPVESDAVLQYLLRSSYDPKHPRMSRISSVAARFLLTARVFRHFIPDFSIVARKPE